MVIATVNIVCGPPCVGKSTYVREHAGPDDIIIDWDEIVTDLGFPPRQHFVAPGLTEVISNEWRRRLALAVAQPGVVWIIRSKPARETEPLAVSLDANLIELTAPLDVLLARAAERPHAEAHRRLITSWHNKYRYRRRR